jgi:hypothetical protein
MSNTETRDAGWSVVASALCLLAAGCTVSNPSYQPLVRKDSELPSPKELSDGGLTPEALVEHDTVVCEPHCEGDVLVGCTPNGGKSRELCRNGCEGDRCLEGTAPPDGCVPETFYLDKDSDGYGDTNETIQACDRPKGYAALEGDCDDGDDEVFPGQEEFHASASKGTGTHDYNCDGIEELEVPGVVSCKGNGGSCVGDGWSSGVPDCGDSGLLASCVQYFGLGCGWWLSMEAQRCR